MSLLAGPSQAASFKDDTSPPHVGCRGSIHAQVIRENPISWYFYLKARVPDGRGEFKEDALDTFFALAESDREQILKTLRTVRIHITDPRPYTLSIDDVLGKILVRPFKVS